MVYSEPSLLAWSSQKLLEVAMVLIGGLVRDGGGGSSSGKEECGRKPNCGLSAKALERGSCSGGV